MSMKRRVETLAGVQTLSVPRAALSRRDLAVVGRRPRSRRGTPCVLAVHAARIERDDQIGGDGAVDGEAKCNLDGREVRRGRYLQSDRTFDQAQPWGRGRGETPAPQRPRELDPSRERKLARCGRPGDPAHAGGAGWQVSFGGWPRLLGAAW